MLNPVIRIAAGLLSLTAIPAAAQIQPGLDNFTLERPAPAPLVTPSQTPRPTPTAPAPAVTPTPAAPSPSATPPVPAPVASATPRATPSATPVPREPPAGTTAPADDPDPAAFTTLNPAPSVVPTVTPDASLPAAVPPAPRANWPVWPFVAGGILVLALAGWWLLRRREEPSTDEDMPAVVEDVPPPPPVATPPTPPRPVAPPLPPEPVADPAARPPGGLVTSSLRPELVFELTPVRAGIDTLRASLDFTLAVGNAGRSAAQDLHIETWLLAADRDPRAVIERLLAREPGEPMLAPFALPPGAAIDLSGQTVTPREGLATITAGERRLFVPMLVVRALWQDGRGGRDGSGAAFMVGVPREGQDRLAPLPLDRGARGYTTLAALRFDG